MKAHAILVLLFWLTFSGQSFGQEPTLSDPSAEQSLTQAQTTEAAKILSFKQWKDREILEVDNRIARLSNQITLLRSEKGYSMSLINKLGSDLRVAQGSSSVVREYTIEQYFNVYLSQFALNPGTIRDVAKSLNSDEIAELLQLYFKSKTPAPSTVSDVRF